MRASSRETELALDKGHKTVPGKPGLRHVPEALDLDFLATGDVGHDYCKGPCMSLFAEADREVLAEVHRAVPHARRIDAQLVDEVPDRLDLRRIGGRDWGWPGSPGFMPADNSAVRTFAPPGIRSPAGFAGSHVTCASTRIPLR